MSVTSLEAEKTAKQEDELFSSGVISIPINVSWKDGICMPDSNGEFTETAYFNTITFGDHFIFDKACRYLEKVGKNHNEYVVDYNEMRRLSLKKNLVDWTLPIPIEREKGWLTSECYKRVCNVSAPLIESFIKGLWNTIEIDEEEEKNIGKQATILFRENSKGVSNACEAVKLYCAYGGFSEKFNFSQQDIYNLPFRDYIRLKMMMDHENESLQRQKNKSEKSNTRVAGPGGKTRPSEGKRVKL